MTPKEFLEITEVIGKLKDVTRHCYTPGGRHESVAEHTYRIALMAYFLKEEFPEADMDKVIKMCLIHDLGEIFTGDIPSFYKTGADEEKEGNLLNQWVESLPAPFNKEMAELYREMDARETLESRIYKALDNLEAVQSHNESDISTWIEREYTLNLDYGNDKVAFSDYLKEFRSLLRKESEEKIKSEKK